MNVKPTVTNCEAIGIIEKEGIGYAVQGYIGSEHFIDPKTRELWENADKALNELEYYLEDRVNGSEGEN